MYLKAFFEVYKILGKLGIKPKDVIGMGGDVVKMGKSLFNTRINPKLLQYVEKNQKIPTKIVENLKIHARTLKNASENQVKLFEANLKDLLKAKTPKMPIKSQSPVTGVQRPVTSGRQLPEWTKGWTPRVIKGGKDPLATGGIANHFRARSGGLEDRAPFKYGGSWADWEANFSDQMTFEEYLRMDLKEKKPHFLDEKADGGRIGYNVAGIVAPALSSIALRLLATAGITAVVAQKMATENPTRLNNILANLTSGPGKLDPSAVKFIPTVHGGEELEKIETQETFPIETWKDSYKDAGTKIPESEKLEPPANIPPKIKTDTGIPIEQKTWKDYVLYTKRGYTKEKGTGLFTGRKDEYTDKEIDNLAETYGIDKENISKKKLRKRVTNRIATDLSNERQFAELTENQLEILIDYKYNITSDGKYVNKSRGDKISGRDLAIKLGLGSDEKATRDAQNLSYVLGKKIELSGKKKKADKRDIDVRRDFEILLQQKYPIIGTKDNPVHHIYGLGNEADYKSSDLIQLKKSVNASLSPFNAEQKKIYKQITDLFMNQPEGWQKEKEELDQKLRDIIKKANDKLPKKYKGITIGYIRTEPIFDENGMVIGLNTIREGVKGKESDEFISKMSSERLKEYREQMKKKKGGLAGVDQYILNRYK